MIHLTVTEAAAIYRKTPRTIRAWARLGKIRGYQIGTGGEWTFHPTELGEDMCRAGSVIAHPSQTAA